LSLTLAVYRRFRARRILDFSAGWGDRLLGALSCPTVEAYVAFDPNRQLRAGHDEMIALFSSPSSKKITQIVYEPFESSSFVLLPQSFDLVFTSPPYFNLERYTWASSSSGQSIDNYPQYDDWLAGFLYPSLNKAWAALKDKGHMVIHLSDLVDRMGVYSRFMICEDMVRYSTTRLFGCEFVGVLLNSTTKSKMASSSTTLSSETAVRPLWVFVKNIVQ
jgi:hypothetical protein